MLDVTVKNLAFWILGSILALKYVTLSLVWHFLLPAHHHFAIPACFARVMWFFCVYSINYTFEAVKIYQLYLWCVFYCYNCKCNRCVNDDATHDCKLL